MTTRIHLRPLADYFSKLRDRRIQLKCQHEFMDIILIVVCGTIAGADDFVSIEEFARAKQVWFRERLGLKLPNGIPSHDTLNRVFATIRPEEFHECFLEWVADVSTTLKLKQIAIDGKTMRGSKKKTATGSCKATHIVSAWASEQGITLAQVKTDEKSNEITAIPELLKLLDVSGALVSIDAMGCQKEIAQNIVAQKGDYLLAVKENQPRLFEDIQRLADEALENNYAGWSTNLLEEKSHGRQEMRFCYVIDRLESIRDRDLWPELKSVVCVVCHREVGDKQSDEVRYYISSRQASAKQFQQAVRGHWSIENPCHWVLDMAFREDDHRLREGHAPENLSMVRKMALTMLKKAKAKCG
ncbi:MAG TPA: ISAs1 family transposase, partial [Gemmata sp.]|nr:ISAs1 family transposase [Gemmata sp.]